VPICAIRGKNNNTTMPEIPEKLKWFTPLDTSLFDISLPYGQNVWRLFVDEMTGSIEVKRAPLLKFFTVVKAVVLAAITAGAFYAIYVYAPFDKVFGEGGNELQRQVCAVLMVVAPLLMVIMIPANDAFMTVQNSKYWKGHLRFRYDPQSGELFFPRENVSYSLKDCSKIVLGCVRGVDKRGWTRVSKNFGGVYYKVGGWHSEGGLSLRTTENTPTTQIFILVLDKNDKWQRHDISYDVGSWQNSESGSKQFIQLVDRLQPFLSFDQFVKDYSQDECYEQQNKG
jgi:hypothetical protein